MAFSLRPVEPNQVSNISQSQGYVPTDIGGSQYSVKADTDLPAVQTAQYDEGINRLKNFPALISKMYANLKAAGKDSDAWLLRDATERFSNSGKSLGVNAFGRAQALADLQGRMRAAANSREAGLSQAESGELLNIDKLLASLGADKAQAVFSQQMQLANFREQKFRDQQNAINTFNSRGGAVSGTVSKPQTNSGAIQNVSSGVTPSFVQPKQPTIGGGFGTGPQPASGSWEAANAEALRTGAYVSQGPNGWVVLSPQAAFKGVQSSAMAGTPQDVRNKATLAWYKANPSTARATY